MPVSYTHLDVYTRQHPYRQKIDVDFSGRVEVYTKQELLNGQNFNPTAVTEQLAVMVLSYDSFRGRGKEVLKAYQENSNLAEFEMCIRDRAISPQSFSACMSTTDIGISRIL